MCRMNASRDTGVQRSKKRNNSMEMRYLDGLFTDAVICNLVLKVGEGDMSLHLQ